MEDEFSNTELQLVYDVVLQAEALLPTLPPTSRHPTQALFTAFGHVADERGLDPNDEAKVDKLLFKIGGSRDGDAITDKFQAVMAKMNITVELDNDGSYSEDSFSFPDGSIDHHEPAVELAPSAPALEQYTDTAQAVQDDNDGSYSEEGASLPGESTDHEPSVELVTSDPVLERYTETAQAVQDDAGASFSEESTSFPEDGTDHHDPSTHLAARASAFEHHLDRTHAIQDVETWQDRTSTLEHRAELYAEAREEDRKAERRDVLGAWHEIANEVDEMPLDELPSNVYSKRVEKIAIRTHEIKSTKNALVSWRQRTRELLHKQKKSQSDDRAEDQDELFQDDPRLSRLAQRTYENLTKSRVLARWSNRVAEEKEKEEIAKKAHEMSLKARVFGLRPKPNLFAALRQRLQDKAESASQQQPSQYQQSADSGPGAATHHDELHGSPDKVNSGSKEQPRQQQVLTDRLPEAASRHGEIHESPDSHDAGSREQSNKYQQSVDSIPVAAAHHVEMHEPPNREDSSSKVQPSQHQVPTDRIPEATSQDDDLDERTQLARRHMLRWKLFNAWENHTKDHKSKVEGFATQKVIEPWRERSSQLANKEADGAQDHAQRRDRQALAQWHTNDRQNELETMASDFQKKTRLGGMLDGWRNHTKTAEAKSEEHSRWAGLADKYRSSVGALRTWKARSRESAVHTGMQREALDTWRDSYEDERVRVEHYEYVAHRVELYRVKEKVLPPWRRAVVKSMQREATLQNYADRADYYSLTTQAIQTWRHAAKEKKKERLRQSYAEARCLVKKAMGARVVEKWHERSVRRNIGLEDTFAEINAARALDTKVCVILHWRERAYEKVTAEHEQRRRAEEVTKQNTLRDWRAKQEEKEQIAAEADKLWERAAKKSVARKWGLKSVTRNIIRKTSESMARSERRRMRDHVTNWHSVAFPGPQPPPPPPAPEATPKRPRLFQLAEPTTTPLAPVPGGIFRQGNPPRKSQLKVSWANFEE